MSRISAADRLAVDLEAAGAEMYGLVRAWYPIPRSLTGAGIREQFRQMGALIPLTVTAVPTGTPLFDWKAPREWNVREAYILTPDGRRIGDFHDFNLHLLAYSTPVRAKMPLAALKEHLFTLPDHPTWVPYRTSYYKEQWAFCLSQEVVDALPEGEYEVVIDTTLEDGALHYAECLLPGETEETVLFSAHACHPSLANDNLSGLALATWLARWLQQVPHRYTYRFVFAPGTVGAIAWLAQHADETQQVRHGLVLSLLGDPHQQTYKRSRRGNALVDHAAAYVLQQAGKPHEVLDFIPYGYDERQYCSPGFNLPMGCLMRARPGLFPEYHTSADNLDLVRPECLADSLDTVLRILEVLEGEATYENLSPYCEPQLGRRGLYGAVGGNIRTREMALLWVLNQSDGYRSLFEIAQRSGCDFAELRAAADALLEVDLLREVEPRA